MLTRAIKTYNNMKRTRFKLTHTLTFFSPSRFFPLLSFSFCFYLNHTVFPPSIYLSSLLSSLYLFSIAMLFFHTVFFLLFLFFSCSWCLFFPLSISSLFSSSFFSCSCCLPPPLSISILSSSSPHSPLGEFWVLFIGKDGSF